MSDIKVGDRVRFIEPHRMAGHEGDVAVVDNLDDDAPYKVVADDGAFLSWTSRVVPADPEPVTDRESLVWRAKSLLTGTPHNGADIIAMAAFLAGE